MYKNIRLNLEGVVKSLYLYSRVDHLVHLKNDVRHNIERIKII